MRNCSPAEIFFPPQRNLFYGDSKMPLSSKPNSLSKTKQSNLCNSSSCCESDGPGPQTPNCFLLFFSSSIYYTAHVTKFTAMNDGQKSCFFPSEFPSCLRNFRQKNIYFIHHLVLNRKSNVCREQYTIQPKQVENNVLWMAWRRESSALFMVLAWKWIISTYSKTLPFIHFLSAFVSFPLYSLPHRE